MRQDEHGWDPKGPPQYLTLRGGLDAQGRITSWETQMWLPKNVPGNRALLGVDAAEFTGARPGRGTHDRECRRAVRMSQHAGCRALSTRLDATDFQSPAPGKIANVFAVESFADEMAAAAGADAVEFRLRALDDPRAIDVLKRAADMIG